MFGRLLWKLLRGNRGRLAVALVAMASGAAVISALFNMQFDVREKMTQEFRSLGANLVISRVGEGERALASEEAMASLAQNLAPAGTIAAPYLYIVARTESGRPVVVAGTHLDLAMQLNPTWRVRGAENGLADNAAACFAGIHAAEAMKLQRGGSVKFKVGE